MRQEWIIVVVLAVGCSPAIRDRNTRTMPHPSATGTVAANEINQSGTYVSLTKVTRDEICVDVSAKTSDYSPEEAIARVAEFVQPRPGRRHIVGKCVGRDQQFHESCASTEPFSGATVTDFAPVIVEVSPSKIPTQQTEKTGNRETVCVEELVNRYDNTVGCARYVEQDETRRIYVDGYKYHARGGRRTCFPNNGQIGPTTTSFTFAYDNQPMLFTFTNGKAVDGAWGGTGGTSAESKPLSNIPGQPTSPAAPAAATPAAPAPTTKVTTSVAGPMSAPTPPPAPVDPLLELADQSFAIPRMKITNQGRVVVEVDAHGVMSNPVGPLGTWKHGALLVKERVMLVVTARGEVLAKGSKRYGRFDRDRLVLENGTTLAIDGRRRFRVTDANGKVAISTATVQTPKEGHRAALLIATLQFNALGFGSGK